VQPDLQRNLYKIVSALNIQIILKRIVMGRQCLSNGTTFRPIYCAVKRYFQHERNLNEMQTSR